MTVYRDGSIVNQPMQKGADKPQPPAVVETGHAGAWGTIRPVRRPKRLIGITEGRTTPEGNLYLTLNLEDGRPFELFAQIGKAGSDIKAFTEAIARLISLAFRCGIDPAVVAEELVGISGSRSVGFGPQRVRSVPDAIGQFIAECLANPAAVLEGSTPVTQGKLELDADAASGENGAVTPQPHDTSTGKVRFNLCPVCGIYAFGCFEGCAKCMACGYSEC